MNKLLTILVLLSLVGCSVAPEVRTEYIEAPVYLMHDIPESFLVKCTPDKPIPIEDYMKKSAEAREIILSKYIVSLYGTISKCNNQLDSIRKYIND